MQKDSCLENVSLHVSLFVTNLSLSQVAADGQTKNIYADYKTCGVAATIDGGWPEPVVTAHDKSPEVST